MPTENRSSNTREQLDALWRDIQDSALRSEDPPHVRFAAAILACPTPQPHPEPIAWMVGTAFWWTKEEAERDAAATGLPIVGLGPMAANTTIQQHQGEPVALPTRHVHEHHGCFLSERQHGWNACLDEIAKLGPLYTHADPARLEKLESALKGAMKLNKEGAERERSIIAERDTLRAQLAEAHELLRDALASHGVMLMSDPPQDPWKTRRIGERIREALSASAEPTSQKITTTEDSKMKDDKTDLPYVEADVNDSILSGKDWATYTIADQPPEYTHMQFSVNRGYGESRSLAELYKHYFVDGVLPELGDEIRMVCTRRTADHLEINLKVFPKTQKWVPYDEICRSQHPGQILTPMEDHASAEPSAPTEDDYLPEGIVEAAIHGQIISLPSAPVEIDERAEFEAHMLRDFPGVKLIRSLSREHYRNPSHEGAWRSWQARAALDRKPS
ncbi:hypothetical protein [Pseudomonas juntendi]|uniref:hypothetical protein n=1 Tax=Pseudomonas juntendi TaxID=2666183 RepID=UPI001F29402C|nr:hypothetical protein [Pseudomonas juntendi]MCO7055149.1 hypothetical protein [Pseudomonas juntendi]UJM10821.1 hypothetical protein L1P09_15900 [Pseudomonas juntendi]UXA41371.1 hypothetical protein KZA81_15210 [Pseudomonas juntendi]